ncbi:C13 family peptidase [Altererythrobacter sp. GH1-8]|uniref:C13 family peptidase n=1 Tax=Altererythrobacter sp. GH1-8 TaxID=3349333 RepID=UPI00374CEAD6
MKGLRKLFALTVCLGFALAAQSSAQDPPEPVQPPPHTQPWPMLGTGNTQGDRVRSLSMGPEMQRGISPKDMLRESRRLDEALDMLAPQRPGTVDAYVVSIALDSDPVFAREAREAGRVLGRRYNAQDRTIVLAGPDGRSTGLPKGSITSLMVALASVAEKMDHTEDVLVLYTTSHGLPQGLAYHYGDTGYGILSPHRLRDTLRDLGIRRRILILSACYSGVFVPFIASPDSAVLTAARADRTSFGCLAENDWTFFGDALINNALRKPQGLEAAAQEARTAIGEWESAANVTPSQPQTSIGLNTSQWLPQLEASIPSQATRPVGRPSFDP